MLIVFELRCHLRGHKQPAVHWLCVVLPSMICFSSSDVCDSDVENSCSEGRVSSSRWCTSCPQAPKRHLVTSLDMSETTWCLNLSSHLSRSCLYDSAAVAGVFSFTFFHLRPGNHSNPHDKYLPSVYQHPRCSFIVACGRFS